MPDYWDNSGLAPDLSRLPLHIRDGMTGTVPFRPDECNAALLIFKQSPGLVHPNARCNVALFRQEVSSGINIENGAQLDFLDFTGRIPLSTVVIAKANLAKVISGLLRVYTTLGGDLETVLAAFNKERLPVERLAYFEESNDQ